MGHSAYSRPHLARGGGFASAETLDRGRPGLARAVGLRAAFVGRASSPDGVGPMNRMQHVFLVPGFFGFSEFGELPYFAHVAELLGARFRDRGWSGRVHRVSTDPTASVPERARRLAEAIQAVLAAEPGDVHLVGHSSGGLDARWLVSPHRPDPEPWLHHVRSVVAVSTPHFGTPVADFFTGAVGRRLLRVLSLATMYTLRYGKLPLGLAFKLTGVFLRVDDVLRLNRTVLDQLYEQLLQDFSDDRRQALSRFFRDVSRDQGLVEQLTPRNMQTFNATVSDRPGVAYGAVATEARRPGVGSVWSAGFDPYAQTTHTLYSVLHSLSLRWPSRRVAERPEVPEEQTDPWLRFMPRLPDRRSSDGVVPTVSQLYGQLVHVARADHLDVVGHFADPRHDPPHYDWLASGSGFRRSEFERLWAAVFEFVGAAGGSSDGVSSEVGPTGPAGAP